MTISLRHPIRGLLVGAAVVPFGYWLAMMADALAREVRFDLTRALRELMVITAFGAPLALAAVFMWGAPVVYVLRRLGILRAATVVVTGAAGGALVGLLFAKFQGGALFRVKMPLPLAVVLGALAGGACWLAGRRSAAPGEADGRSEHSPSEGER